MTSFWMVFVWNYRPSDSASHHQS